MATSFWLGTALEAECPAGSGEPHSAQGTDLQQIPAREPLGEVSLRGILAHLRTSPSTEPSPEGPHQEPGVEPHDHGRNHPCQPLECRAVRKGTHLGSLTGELNQRDDSKSQLQAENDLAQDEKRPGSMLTVECGHNDGRHDCDQARDESTEPRW